MLIRNNFKQFEYNIKMRKYLFKNLIKKIDTPY